jgi:hypothetical protein
MDMPFCEINQAMHTDLQGLFPMFYSSKAFDMYCILPPPSTSSILEEYNKDSKYGPLAPLKHTFKPRRQNWTMCSKHNQAMEYMC